MSFVSRSLHAPLNTTRAAWTAVEHCRPPMHAHDALDSEARSPGFWHRLCNAFSMTHARLTLRFACISKKMWTTLEDRGQLRRAKRTCRSTPTSIYVRILIQKELRARSEFTPALHLVIPDANGSSTADSSQRDIDHLITKFFKAKEIGKPKFRKVNNLNVLKDLWVKLMKTLSTTQATQLQAVSSRSWSRSARERFVPVALSIISCTCISKNSWVQSSCVSGYLASNLRHLAG